MNAYITRHPRKCDAKKRMGDRVFSKGGCEADELPTNIGLVSGVIYIDDLGTISEIGDRVIDWDKGWSVVNKLLVNGNTVLFVKEGIELKGAEGDAYKALCCAAAAINTLRSARQTKSVGSYQEKMAEGINPSNWKLPDEAFLRLLVSKVSGLGVAKACHEMGISKQSYYNWKKKKLI
ncbi:hypothetical protein [Cellvibrio sp. QJXJ]|uniref:hypothetical protein n=1 Tax=Cellvibrio sp. QJXJ TaxID=2964606 RepID=UPI0021C3566D|nr:hypothetical protein [Cellvibrio sp. QJXJ]UUA75133.1 hypothetical protein NNX04_22005 [Cellvibrio sp. QJXJ]